MELPENVARAVKEHLDAQADLKVLEDRMMELSKLIAAARKRVSEASYAVYEALGLEYPEDC